MEALPNKQFLVTIVIPYMDPVARPSLPFQIPPAGTDFKHSEQVYECLVSCQDYNCT